MRKINQILLTLAMFSTLPDTSAQIQSHVEPVQFARVEPIELYTDRSVYAIHEMICFSAITAGDKSLPILSTVIYVELIKWNGNKIVQTKNPVYNSVAHGVLKIPGDLESGVYYLRAYTKWMRNFSPYNYAYLPLKIVNPGTNKIESGPAAGEALERIPDSLQLIIDNDKVFSGLKETYGTRELIEFELGVTDEKYAGNYCLSAVRNGTLDPSMVSFSFHSGADWKNEEKQRFLPEIFGLSLSGKAIDKESGKPIHELGVNLSSTSEPVYYTSTRTDSSGVFLFTFPQIEGMFEFNLSSENETGRVAELFIETDFCYQPISLPYIAFHLDETERSTLTEVVKNMQIRRLFTEPDTLTENIGNEIPFFGRPTRTIYEKDFIELDNFQEFLYELVYEVVVRYHNGEPQIYFIHPATLSAFPALVFMDHVKVNNLSDLLKVACRRIDRIEVLKKGYVVGESYYSGIISIHSERNDMAGLKPSLNSYFFNMDLFHSQEIIFPAYKEEAALHNRIPDRRTTLFWEPKIEVSQTVPGRIRFYTSDATGDYTLILRGITEAGTRILFEQQFKVK